MSDWKKGKISEKKVIGKLAIYSYNFLKNKFHDHEDAASEIFCEVLRRLPRIINLFTFRGIPFEAYLHISIKKAISSYFRREKKESTLENYAAETFYESMEEYSPVDSVAESVPMESAFLRSYTDETNAITDVHQHMRKRVLCLACKNAYFIDNRLIQRTAHLAGVSDKWLASIVEDLRTTMAERLERYEQLSLRKQQNLAFTYLMEVQQAQNPDAEQHEKYRKKYAVFSSRAQKLNLKLKSVPLTPTHIEIAKALKMPKGSVDSGLHYLRRFNARSKKDNRS